MDIILSNGLIFGVDLAPSVISRIQSLICCCSGGALVRVHVLHMENDV